MTHTIRRIIAATVVAGALFATSGLVQQADAAPITSGGIKVTPQGGQGNWPFAK